MYRKKSIDDWVCVWACVESIFIPYTLKLPLQWQRSVTKPELLGPNGNNTENIYRYLYENKIEGKRKDRERKRERGL